MILVLLVYAPYFLHQSSVLYWTLLPCSMYVMIWIAQIFNPESFKNILPTKKCFLRKSETKEYLNMVDQYIMHTEHKYLLLSLLYIWEDHLFSKYAHIILWKQHYLYWLDYVPLTSRWQYIFNLKEREFDNKNRVAPNIQVVLLQMLPRPKDGMQNSYLQNYIYLV